MEAYIFDAVRTPRGKGKKDGSLHGVTPLRLAETALRALVSRNNFDSAIIDDVVLGCVEPVGEQGACIGRVAALASGYAESVAGVQINRFCASGLEACNMAAAQVMSGQSDMVVGGGVEAMSRVPMGRVGTAARFLRLVAVEFVGALRLGAYVHEIGHTRLHPERHLVLLDARVRLGIAHGAVRHLIELPEPVELTPAHLRRDAG